MTGNAAIVWAIADHPWIDEIGGAAVRVAMTVVGRNRNKSILVLVDDAGTAVAERTVSRLNSDLSADADVGTATNTPLLANSGLSSNGFYLRGAGFLLQRDEAEQILSQSHRNADIVRPFVNGRDLAARPRDLFVIDFADLDEGEAALYPVLYDIVRTRVYPERQGKKEKQARDVWWQFWRTRGEIRQALNKLGRYMATPYVAKHRYFLFLDGGIAPDDTVIVIAIDEQTLLGVLSSSIHLIWAEVAGSRLGVGNDPRYNKSRCFDPFPFPDPPPDLRARIGDVAERLDAHRKEALARDERVTMTGMYNVLEKLKSGESLTKREREIHEIAACGILRDLHEELDHLVAEAYGWPWPMSKEEILERLVALHAERVEEEKRGIIRWLRPEYQRPRFAPANEVEAPAPESTEAAPAAEEAREPWPTGIIEQLTALRALLGSAALEPEEAAARFEGAPLETVRGHLELLAGSGEVWRDAEGRYQRAEQPV